MPQNLHNLIEGIQAHLGRVSSCAWVEERLIAYCDWDLPEHEFLAIERHLAHCPACTRAYNEVAPLVDSIQEQEIRAQLPGFSPAQFAAATMARINAYERARVSTAGVLLCSRKIAVAEPAMCDIAPTVLKLMGFSAERLQSEDFDGRLAKR